MIFVCKFCDLSFINILAVKRHVFKCHLKHKMAVSGLQLYCTIDDCGVKLNSVESLRKHVQRHHYGKQWSVPKDWYWCKPGYNHKQFNTIVTNEPDDDISNSAIQCTDSFTNHSEASVGMLQELEVQSNNISSCNTGFSSHNISCNSGLSHKATSSISTDVDIKQYTEFMKNISLRKQQMAVSLFKLKSDCHLTEAGLLKVQSWAEDLLQEALSSFVGGLKLCEDFVVTSEVEDLLQFSHGLANPFHMVNTEYKRKQLLPNFVTPKQVVLLEEQNQYSDALVVTHSMQYIPLLELLQTLFSCSSLSNHLHDERQASTVNSMLESMWHGNYLTSHPLYSVTRDALELLFYYDDFEVVNPIDSKTITHKMGAIYFIILNVHHKFNSCQHRIFLNTLFYSKDVKHSDIGWNKVLQPLNEDIRVLESDGICVKVQGNLLTLKGTVTQLVADNLAAHSILGFKECFSGKNAYISRYCLCTGLQIQEQEHPCIRREKLSYLHSLKQVLESGIGYQGIKQKCFLQSQYFCPVENYVADFHHDVLEGVVPYVLKIVLQKVIFQKKYFTVENLNTKINFYHYGVDQKNKPSNISRSKLMDDNSRNLGQNASQYWCLARFLPLLVGSRIPSDDCFWKFYLTFLEILDIVSSPRVSNDSVTELEVLLQEFFREFKRLYPTLAIIPKMHFLLLYPQFIREIGPLALYSCMRFEAKHKQLKELVTRGNNYKNTAYTIAVQHQLQLAVHLNKKDLFGSFHHFKNAIDFNDVDFLQHCDMTSFGCDTNMLKASEKATIDGVSYDMRSVVCFSVSEEGVPEFLLVRFVSIDSASNIWLIGQKILTSHFEEHFHAWVVELLDILTCVRQNNLVYPHPLSLTSPFGSFLLIVRPKFRLEETSY